MSWSNEIIAEFLSLYEQEPIIWNPKHIEHKDRNAVHDAWMRIKQKLSITSTISELKKKKESLMGSFRKLNKKVKASMTTGSSADDVFKPDWFAYEQMAKFLQSISTPRETKSSDEQSQEMEYEGEAPNNVDISENSATREVSENPTPTDCNTFKAPTSVKVSEGKKRKITIDEDKKRKDEAYNFLEAMRDKPKEDECSLFSELLCQKLRTLDKNMRDMAMHQIDCLMFSYRQQQNRLASFPHEVLSFPSESRFPFTIPSHPQLSPGFPSSPHYHSQPSPGFSPSSYSHQSQLSPQFPPSPHSQPSPGFPPSPHSYPQQSSGFIPSSESHPQLSLGLSPSPQSQSQASPGFPPSPHSHSQVTPVFLHSHSQPPQGFSSAPNFHSPPPP